MTKGRKKISDQAKVMKGTDQPVRMSGAEIPDMAKLPKLPTPRGLGKTGKKIYRSTGNILLSLGILNELCLPTFFQYCREMELYLDAMENMPNLSDMIHVGISETGDITTRVKALRKIAQDALANTKSLASELGLTPSAQAKIIGMLTKGEQKSELDQFFE